MTEREAAAPAEATSSADAAPPVTGARRQVTLKRSDVLAALLVAILLVAFWLRFHDLETNPPELFEDELAGAASAWSVVTTVHDVEQDKLPFLPTRLELKQPLYFFATVLPRAVLGRESAVAVRLPAVAFGLLGTALLFWVMRMLGRGDPEALMAAALFATVPWAVHYGRIGWEPAVFVAPCMAGIGLLWTGLDRQRPRWIVAGGVVLALGAYGYHPAVVAYALIAAAAVALHLRSLRRDQTIALLIAGAVAVVLLIPYANAFLNEPLFTMRTKNVSIFKDGLSPAAIGLAWVNYWQQWNPQWLFFSVVPNPRYHPTMPVLFAWILPFFFLGLVRLLRRQQRADLCVLAWLALGALPAGITNDGVPHFARGLLALPPILMVTASGMFWVWDWLWQKPRVRGAALALAAVFAVGVTVMGVRQYGAYYRDFPAAVAPNWHYSPAPALRALPTIVPPGATLCIDVPDGVSFWTFPHNLAFYLPDRQFEVIEGLKLPRCAEPGTFILYGLFYSQSMNRLPVSLRQLATIQSAGRPMFIVGVVPPR